MEQSIGYDFLSRIFLSFWGKFIMYNTKKQLPDSTFFVWMDWVVRPPISGTKPVYDPKTPKNENV